MRRWDEDGVPDPEASRAGEFILKVAMARLPNNPYLLTLLAHTIIETRRDGQAARTQLQLAVKASPGLLDRFFIYVAQETTKKLKSEGERASRGRRTGRGGRGEGGSGMRACCLQPS
jgi:hypothetical protein